MLPDYPYLKEKLHKLFISQIKAAHSRYMIPFSDSPKTFIHEGNKIILVREDGSIEDLEIKETKSNIEINLKKVETMPFDTMLIKADTIAQEMAMQQSKVVFEELDKGIKKVGNFIDAKGKPFSIDLYFQMLEKMLLDFNEDGNPNLPTIIAGEKAFKSISEVLSKSDIDPTYIKTFDEIISRKREEWRVRESNRKLVG